MAGVVTDDGLFEGKISTQDGEQYVIARSKHYFPAAEQPEEPPRDFHSVIYRHSDVHIPSLGDSQCKSDEIHTRIRTKQKEHGRKHQHAQAKRAESPAKYFHTRLKEQGPHVESGEESHIRGPEDSNFDWNAFEHSRMHETQHYVKLDNSEDLEDKSRVRGHLPSSVHRNGVTDKMNQVREPGSNTEHQHSRNAQAHHETNRGHHRHQPHHSGDTAESSPNHHSVRLKQDKALDVSASVDDLKEVDVAELSAQVKSQDSDSVRKMNQFTASDKSSGVSTHKDRTPDIPLTDNKHPSNSSQDMRTGKDSSVPHHQHSRQKRAMIDPSKITCTLYLQADHLFFQKFHSSEETVIEQLTQHVQGVNEIYKAIGEREYFLYCASVLQSRDHQQPFLLAAGVAVESQRRRVVNLRNSSRARVEISLARFAFPTCAQI